MPERIQFYYAIKEEAGDWHKNVSFKNDEAVLSEMKGGKKHHKYIYLAQARLGTFLLYYYNSHVCALFVSPPESQE